MIDDRPTVPCKWCGTPTPMTGTKMCDPCWELDTKIRMNPKLAARIVDAVKAERPELFNPKGWDSILDHTATDSPK